MLMIWAMHNRNMGHRILLFLSVFWTAASAQVDFSGTLSRTVPVTAGKAIEISVGLPSPSKLPVNGRIAVEWAGVGSWDASIRDGSWAEGRTKFPLVPGLDGAGIVVACGARVRRLKIGDRVYAYEFGNSKGGFYAQYAAVHANHADRVPKPLEMRDAAAMVTTALTAMQGIDRARLRKGTSILIFGASGAVGTMAVQFAKRHGATVIATASGRPAARVVLGLGADYVIDARRRTVLRRARRRFGIVAVGGHLAVGLVDPCVDPRIPVRSRAREQASGVALESAFAG